MDGDIDIVGSWLEIGMTIAAIAAGVITVLIPLIRRRVKKNFNTNLDYPKSFRWEIHTRLHETLTELRVRTDCARSQIVQFHNSGEFLDGVSMKKFSLTHESLNIGTIGEGDQKKDMLITMFLYKLNLLKEDKAAIHIVDSMSDTYSKQYMQNSNVIAFSMLPIRKKKEIVGYVMIQWCSWNKVDLIDENVVGEEMENARTHIEVQLQQQLRPFKENSV